MTAPLLSIQKLSPDNLPFPAYFISSTAPLNIEDQDQQEQDQKADGSLDPQKVITEISHHLQKHQDNAEILIVIHGYNTSQEGAQQWSKSIYQHLSNHHQQRRSPGLILICYRWPSEKISPRSTEVQELGSSCLDKLRSARAALPVALGKISRYGIIGLVGGISGIGVSIVAIAMQFSQAIAVWIIFAILASFSLGLISFILTMLALRLTGYFRDSYRATNFGVADLVELIRQIDNALVEATPGIDRDEQEKYWAPQEHDQARRIKLSFIGHSMGAFVVTNAVRILSDVFDASSIGSIDTTIPDKNPSSSIGHVFSLGRLVLVSPDIPAETIISGRANFLQSSLRRFEESYLFSNEGDMALRLASTAANYFSYPTKTQDGGYRLGNVAVRNSTKRNKDGEEIPGQALSDKLAMRAESYGLMARLTNGQLVDLQAGQELPLSGYPLDYLYIREQTPLSARQKTIALAPNQKPIGESFTFFDCTDYTEKYLDRRGQAKTAGLLSRAQRKPALNFPDYVFLSIDYFRGKIDTHGGYFSDGERNKKPAATFTKLAIYGLASLGFEKFLLELPSDHTFQDYRISYLENLKKVQAQYPHRTALQQEKIAVSHSLANICRDRGIQVLLAQERYTKDVLK
jgi:hypothetical protein